MKIGFQLVLYLLCLNLACGLCYTLGIAGTSYSNPVIGSGNATDYQNRFDPDRIMNQTQPNIISEFPFLGGVYGGLMMFWNAISFIILGFPRLLYSFSGAIQDPIAKAAYNIICDVLVAVCMFIWVGFLFQIITGRQVQD